LISHNQFAFRYSDHARHGIAFSSLTGIAGGLRNIIKGGENSTLLIGTIDIHAVREFQKNYFNLLNLRLKKIRNKEKLYKSEKSIPEIKKLPARFDNVRTKE
jgi:hypothetical protein